MNEFSIGVDLGGTNLRVGAYSPERGVYERRSARTRLEQGPHAVASDICALVRAVVQCHPSISKAIGLCLGAPGPLELPRGRFHQPPNLPGWDGFDLKEKLAAELNMPVTLENDANLAALAECRLGSGKDLGVDSLCMLTLGTGVGSGIILDGRIFHGANGLAGEAGHITVWPDDSHICGCGNHGCLELYASATGIVRQAIELAEQGSAEIRNLLQATSNITAGDLYIAAKSGNQDAAIIFQRAGSALGIAIADLINTLNPALIVIAGGVSEAWPLFSDALLEQVTCRSYVYRLTSGGTSFSSQTVIRQAVLGNDAGLVGAALYPFLTGDMPLT